MTLGNEVVGSLVQALGYCLRQTVARIEILIEQGGKELALGWKCSRALYETHHGFTSVEVAREK